MVRNYKNNELNDFDNVKTKNRIINIDCVKKLNNLILNGEYPDLIRTIEASHEEEIDSLAQSIIEQKKRVILIAGPTSSGKTTFANRLAMKLKLRGVKPISISMDDYFVDRENTPLDEDGRYDFESVNALDLVLFNKDLNSILNGEEVELPTYNFVRGKREYNGNIVSLEEDHPIILEGIHGLNPIVTSKVRDSEKFKIYISPVAQLNLDSHNKMSTNDIRLVRRIVRDNKFRGASANATLNMWNLVKRGEEKYIEPYKKDADRIFNSSLIYDISVLKKYIEPLLISIIPEDENYDLAKRILQGLSYFVSLDDEKDIPAISIINEFIGKK